MVFLSLMARSHLRGVEEVGRAVGASQGLAFSKIFYFLLFRLSPILNKKYKIVVVGMRTPMKATASKILKRTLLPQSQLDAKCVVNKSFWIPK